MRSQTITPTMTTDTAIAAEDGAAPTLAYASRGAGITGMLSNVKVRTRLLLLAGVLGLLWALVVIFSMTGVGSVKHHDSTTNAYRALQTQAKSAYQGWLTEDDVMHIYASLAVIGTPAAKAEMKEMLAYIGSEHTASLRGLNAVIAGSSDPKVLADATKALAIIKSYEAFVSQVKAQVAAGHVINADNIAAVHYLAAATQVSTAFTALSARLQALVDAGASNVSSSIANTKTLLWIVTGISARSPVRSAGWRKLQSVSRVVLSTLTSMSTARTNSQRLQIASARRYPPRNRSLRTWWSSRPVISGCSPNRARRTMCSAVPSFRCSRACARP
jgi:hypothetical protein